MFGRTMIKYCPTCNENKKVHVSTGYILEDKVYFTNCICRTCKTDLSKEDRLILQQARLDGKDIGVVMY